MSWQPWPKVGSNERNWNRRVATTTFIQHESIAVNLPVSSLLPMHILTPACHLKSMSTSMMFVDIECARQACVFENHSSGNPWLCDNFVSRFRCFWYQQLLPGVRWSARVAKDDEWVWMSHVHDGMNEHWMEDLTDERLVLPGTYPDGRGHVVCCNICLRWSCLSRVLTWHNPGFWVLVCCVSASFCSCHVKCALSVHLDPLVLRGFGLASGAPNFPRQSHKMRKMSMPEVLKGIR